MYQCQRASLGSVVQLCRLSSMATRRATAAPAYVLAYTQEPPPVLHPVLLCLTDARALTGLGSRHGNGPGQGRGEPRPAVAHRRRIRIRARAPRARAPAVLHARALQRRAPLALRLGRPPRSRRRGGDAEGCGRPARAAVVACGVAGVGQAPRLRRAAHVAKAMLVHEAAPRRVWPVDVAALERLGAVLLVALFEHIRARRRVVAEPCAPRVEH